MPGENHGQRSLASYSPWGLKESDTTERLSLSLFPGGSDGKESACSVEDSGLIPGLGSFPGEGDGYPFQYSCLENPTDREAWRATVHGVSKSQTQLSTHTGISESLPEERKLVNGSKKAVLGINKRP